jgi:hypothetical protein
MPIDNAALQAKARAAYEAGRVRQALASLLLVMPLVACSLYICGTPAVSLSVGALVAAVVVVLDWRGQELGRGARLGLMAGVAGFVLPVVFHATGWCCRLGIEQGICVASGVAAGLIVATRLKTVARERALRLAASAGVVAALTGALGCAFLGVGGVLGVAGGVLAVTMPAVLLARAPA